MIPIYNDPEQKWEETTEMSYIFDQRGRGVRLTRGAHDIEAQVQRVGQRYIPTQIEQPDPNEVLNEGREEEGTPGCFSCFNCFPVICMLPGAILWGIGSQVENEKMKSTGIGLTSFGLFYFTIGQCMKLLIGKCARVSSRTLSVENSESSEAL